MPKRDGKGPLGLGPNTGKGCGPCGKVKDYALSKTSKVELTSDEKVSFKKITDKILGE